jgi:methenyltetrahydromethanopterin cyclohydrolase
MEQKDGGVTVYDFGVEAPGGLDAGLMLAEICLAGLATVRLESSAAGPTVAVYTDHPVAACMGSQYAGWQVQEGKYFAMGSGPMRAVAAKEELIKNLQCVERVKSAVGVLESAVLPPRSVCARLASECDVILRNMTLCVASTASIAGTVQVVARSVETALHKLYELGFDLNRVASGFGFAPLPPVAADNLVGIGRTNDAILYGGQVTLWVRDEDDRLEDLAPRVPSQSSKDHGAPFADILQRYDGDFYQIDPLLFSPAKICLVNLDTGRSFSAGELREDLLSKTF